MGQNIQRLYEAFALDTAAWTMPQQAPQIAPHVVQQYVPVAPKAPPGGYPPQQVNSFGATPVYVVPNTPSGGVVPKAGVASSINGATVIAVGPLNGGWVINPPNAASQNVGSVENIYIDFVAPPGNTDAAGYGTTSIILTGGTFTIPAIAAGVTVWVNAATAGHHISVVTW